MIEKITREDAELYQMNTRIGFLSIFGWINDSANRLIINIRNDYWLITQSNQVRKIPDFLLDLLHNEAELYQAYLGDYNG